MNDPLRPIFKSSTQAAVTPVRLGTPKYPWADVPPGKSFAVNHSEIKFSTLRTFASRMQKKHGKKFRVVNHQESGVYEVACLPQTTEEAVATSSTLFEALDKIKGSGE